MLKSHRKLTSVTAGQAAIPSACMWLFRDACQYQPGRKLSAAVWSLLWARGPTHSQLGHGLALCRLVPACPHICLLDRVPIRGCPLSTTGDSMPETPAGSGEPSVSEAVRLPAGDDAAGPLQYMARRADLSP